MDTELIKIVVILLIMIGAAAVQFLNKVKEQQNKGPGPVQPRSKPLEAESGECLRRAAQHHRSPNPSAPQPAAARKSASPPPLRRSEFAGPTETVDPPRGTEVVEHVRKYLNTAEFQRRADHLADEVSQADEKMDEHLHDVFDHRLGQFAQSSADTSPGVAAESSSTAVSALVALLASPQGLRQAIVINEILQRPEQRWS